MDVQYTPEESQLTKLYRMVDHVCIKLGHVRDDPVIWEFYIKNENGKTEVIQIDAEKLEKQAVFRAQYLKKFFTPAPKVNTTEWLKFLQIMGEKAERIQNTEESENVYLARQVYEEICRYEPTEDGNLILRKTSRKIYSHLGYYCLQSRRVEEIVKERGYRITQISLSTTMTELGLKRPGTPTVRIGGGTPRRCWWFYPNSSSEGGL